MLNQDLASAQKAKIVQDKAAAKKKHETSSKALRNLNSSIGSARSSISSHKSALTDIAVDLSKHSMSKQERSSLAGIVSGDISDLKSAITRSTQNISALKGVMDSLKSELKASQKQNDSKEKEDKIRTLEGKIKLLDHKIEAVTKQQDDNKETLSYLQELELLLSKEMSQAEKWLRPNPDYSVQEGIARLKAELSALKKDQEMIATLKASHDKLEREVRADFVATNLMDLIDEGIDATLESLRNKGGVEIITKELLLNPDSITFDKIAEIFKALQLGALASFVFFNMMKIPTTVSALSDTISAELLEKGLDLNLDNIVAHSEFVESLVLNPALINMLNGKRFEIGQIVSILEKDIGNIVDFVLSTPSTLKPETTIGLVSKVLGSKENFQNIIGIVADNFSTFLELTSEGKRLHDVLISQGLIGQPSLIKDIAINFLPVLNELKQHHSSIVSILAKVPTLLSAVTDEEKAAALDPIIRSAIQMIQANDASMLKTILEFASSLNFADVATLAFSAGPVQEILSKFGIDEKDQETIIAILSKPEFQDFVSTLAERPAEISALLTELLSDEKDNSASLMDALLAVIKPSALEGEDAPKSLLSLLGGLFQSLEDADRDVLSGIVIKAAKVLLADTIKDLKENKPNLEELLLTEEKAIDKSKEDLEQSKGILLAHLEALLASGIISREEFNRLKDQISAATTVAAIQVCVVEIRSSRSSSFSNSNADINALNSLQVLLDQENSKALLSAGLSVLPDILFERDQDLDNIRKILGEDDALTLGAIAISAVKLLQSIVSNTQLVDAVRGLLQTDQEQLATLAAPIVYRAITPDYAGILVSANIDHTHEHHSFLHCALESHFAEHEHTNTEKLLEILKLRMEAEHVEKIHSHAVKEFTRIGGARTAALGIIKKPEFKGVLNIADNVLDAHAEIATKISGMDDILRKLAISASIENQIKNKNITPEKREELFKLATENELSGDDMSKLVDFALTFLASADIGHTAYTDSIMSLLNSDETKELLQFAFNMDAEGVESTIAAAQGVLAPAFELASLFLGNTEVTDLNTKLQTAITSILAATDDPDKSGNVMENVKPLVGWLASILKNDRFNTIYGEKIVPFITQNEKELVKQLDTIIKQDPDLRFMKLDAQKIVNIMKDPETAKNLAEFVDAFSKGEIWRTSKTAMSLAFGSHDAFSMLVNAGFGLIRKAFREVLMPDFLKRMLIGNQVTEKLLRDDFTDLADYIKSNQAREFGPFSYFTNRLNLSGLDLTGASNQAAFHDKVIDGIDFSRCRFDNGLDLNGATVTNTDLSNLKFGPQKEIILTNATIDLDTFKTIAPLINQGVEIKSIGLKIEIPHLKMHEFAEIVSGIKDLQVRNELSACVLGTHAATVNANKAIAHDNAVMSH